MKLFNKNNKKNKGSVSAYGRQGGFTIVEAIVAIFILTVSVSSMLGVTASSIASARYARNEITANYLLQEAVDSIRNSRDTIAFERRDTYGWTSFLDRYGYTGSSKCFSDKGCYLDTENFKPEDISGPDVISCDGVCPLLNVDNTDGYNYSTGTPSIFTRWVKMEVSASNPDEVKVTAYINWKNESTSTPKSQSLEIYLLNWQK